MHRALIQKRPGFVSPCHVAAQGFSELGYDVDWFTDDDFAALTLEPDCIVVAGVTTVLAALRRLDIDKRFPTLPTALLPFAGRRISLCTLVEARRQTPPFFMKPAEDAKVFGGVLVRSALDLVSSASCANDMAVIVSAPITLRSEFRCFVIKGEVVGCRHYKGDPLAFPRRDRIEAMVATWSDAPAGWALDVGVTDEDETVVVEVNDGHSTGDYGLPPLHYARFLEARWCELTGATPIP